MQTHVISIFWGSASYNLYNSHNSYYNLKTDI